jgi:glycosyltransferase involved in cell wall biosynthesis
MEHDPRVELAILGHLELPADFSRCGSRVQIYEPVSWEKVPEVLCTFDINMAPLELANPFCRAKSELKYFEAGILGIPTVASHTDEFGYAIENGKNGFLVSDQRELEACLFDVVNDPELRQRVGSSAREDVLLRYVPRARAKDLVQILHQIKERAATDALPMNYAQ